MQDAPFKEIDYSPGLDYDPLLDTYHNTRHASQRHAFLQDKQGWHLRSPWLSRFDWILDAHLEADFWGSDQHFLTKQRRTPRTVFVKASLIELFIRHVLPTISHRILLYLGNDDLPLSAYGEHIRKIVAHPIVHQVFAENRDIDIEDIIAMPLGIHPREMLQANSVLELQKIAENVNPDRKRNKVFGAWGDKKHVLHGRSDREKMRQFMQSHPDACDYFAHLPLHEFWRSMSGYRFMLSPWGHVHDSAKTFEALIVKTIPIILSGPYSHAYRDLPVVVIDDLEEINPQNLRRWWESLSGYFDDSSFLYSDYWWHRIEQALPVKKKAFLVLGPESHGNHLVTDILVNAGCLGHSGDHTPWSEPWRKDAHNDLQPWDRALPTDQDPVVWRRSVPHLKQLPAIKDMVDKLEMRDYQVTAIIVCRERYAAQQSQIKWRHVENSQSASTNIQRAYKHIFSQLDEADIHFVVTSYEALVNYPEAQDSLLRQLDLALPELRLEVWDGNQKWYESIEKGGCPESAETITVPSSTVREFPESWFSCFKADYRERITRGKQRMQSARAVFCGIARDVADELPSVSRRIESAGSMFADYRVVVFENDSCDGTLDLLRDWQLQNARVSVLHETLNVRRWGSVPDPERMAHLAYCRNQYLQHIAEHLSDFDYFIVFDTDIPRGFSYEGLANTFGFQDWDMVGSNGILVPQEGRPPPDPMFFDAWAYRVAGSSAQSLETINRLQFHRGEALHPVWSCFGGLAVYRMACALSGARYGGTDCEHVVFHQQLRELGLTEQFLNPSQIVFYTGRPQSP